MDQIVKTFYDVEHGGDAQEILDILNDNNAVIINKSFNYDAEQLQIIFEVPDKKAFAEAVKDEYWFG